MLQKEKHEFIKNILQKYVLNERLDDADFSTIVKWYKDTGHASSKEIERIVLAGSGKFGTKCLRFIFEDGTHMPVSRHIIVGKKRTNPY